MLRARPNHPETMSMYLSGRRSRSWTPANITTAAVTSFFDAENNAKLTNDGAGLCLAWVDTNSAVTFTAATTARPTIQTSTTTNRQVLQYNGTANAMVVTPAPAGYPLTGAFEYHMIGVQEGVSGDGANRTFFGQGSTSNQTTNMTRGSVNSGALNVGTGSGNPNTTVLTGVWTGAFYLALIANGTTIQAFFNSNTGSPYTGNSSACVPSLSAERCRLGASGAAVVGNFWKGGISAFLLITGTLSGYERLQMHFWAQRRMGG